MNQKIGRLVLVGLAFWLAVGSVGFGLFTKRALALTPFVADDALGQVTGIGDPSFTTYDSHQLPEPNNIGVDTVMSVAYDNVRHRLFVADGNNRVLVYATDENGVSVQNEAQYVLGQPDFVTNSADTTQSKMDYPYALCFDPIENRLFVGDESNHRTLIYDLSSGITNGMNASYVLGQPDFTTAGSTASQSLMRNSTGIAYDPTGKRLFVSDSTSHRVLIFDISGGITNTMNASYVLGQSDFTTITSGLTQSKFNSPDKMAFDDDRDLLFVGDHNNHRTLVFDISSGITNGMNASYVLGQADFTSNAAAITQAGQRYPGGVSFDPSTNRLFVALDANAQGSRLVVYDTTTLSNGMNASYVLSHTDFVGTASTNPSGRFAADYAEGVYYSPDIQRLYVGDWGNYRVLSFDISGGITNGMNADDVFGVLNAEGERDTNVDWETTDILQTWNAGPYYSSSWMNYPSGAVLDPVDHRLFALDSADNRIMVYQLNSDNELQSRHADYIIGKDSFYDQPYSGSQLTQSSFDWAYGIDYDTTNKRLFLADYLNNRVLVFDVSSGITSGMNASYVLGQVDFTSDGLATTQAGMYGPGGIAVNETTNQLFVTDWGNNRLLVYDLSSGIANGMNASYVLGQPDFISSDAATTQAGMDGPEGITIDEDDNLVFVSADNNRITVYDLSSGITNGMNASYVLGQSDFTSSTSSVSQNQFVPYAINYDQEHSRLFVTDMDANRALVFDLSSGITNGMNAAGVIGQPDFTSFTGGTSQTALGFSSATGVYYDSSAERLYLAEDGNSRMSVFYFPRLNPIASTATIGQSYSAILGSQTEGTPNYVVLSGDIPPGLSLNAGSGVLSGVPTQGGTYSFRARVSDNNGVAGTFLDERDYTITIPDAPDPGPDPSPSDDPQANDTIDGVLANTGAPYYLVLAVALAVIGISVVALYKRRKQQHGRLYN